MALVCGHVANELLGTTEQKTTVPLRLGFDREERRHAIHTILWPEPVQDIYGIICRCR